MTTPYALDQIFAPITIIADVNDEIVTSTGSVFLDPGTYWPYIGTAITGYPSFYAHVITKFGGGTFLPETLTGLPSGSPFTKTGIRLEGSGRNILTATLHESLRPLFGLQEWATSGALNDDTQSDFSMGYQWLTPRRARDKRGDETIESYFLDSLEVPRGRIWRQWSDRVMEYARVPAACVRESRAREASGAYAANAMMKADDTNNNWQRIWRIAATGAKLLVIHNEGGVDWDVSSHPWEALVMTNDEQRQRFGATLPQERTRVEAYTVKFNARIIGGNYSHD